MNKIRLIKKSTYTDQIPQNGTELLITATI